MLVIRVAEVDDAPAIAKVHVATWRSTYGGIIPQAYLDRMSVANRSAGWVRLLDRGPAAGLTTFVSEDRNGTVVGYVSFGPSRHDDRRFAGEISSLYVLKGHQGAGHGRRLFLAAANRLAVAGHKGLFVWVLADNPARGFYEAMAGTPVADVTRGFAGTPLHEIGYGWTETPRYGD
jgi:GNAT superfamily N-acetyltransferase